MRTLTTAVLSLVLLVSLPAFADENANQQTADGQNIFSPGQQQEAQQALKALGAAFGVTPEQTTQPQQEAQEPVEQPKTVADVADKALDMAATFVTTISEKMEEVAPTIWRVMIKQQYAKAIGGVVTPAGLMAVFFFFILIARHTARKGFEKDEGGKPITPKILNDKGGPDGYLLVWIFTTLLPSIALGIVAITFVVCLSDSIMYVVNPEYYAVKDLLRMLLAPGAAAQ